MVDFLAYRVIRHPCDYKKLGDWQKIFKFLDKHFDAANVGSFLDLGAGMGNLVDYFLLKNPSMKIICEDINPDYLKIISQREPQVETIVHNLNSKIPFADQSFDLVSCIGVFQSKRINIEEVLKEVIRVSKKYIFLDFFLKLSPYVFLERIRYSDNESRRYWPSEFQKLFESLNVKEVAKAGTRTIFPELLPFSGKTIMVLLEKK